MEALKKHLPAFAGVGLLVYALYEALGVGDAHHACKSLLMALGLLGVEVGPTVEQLKRYDALVNSLVERLAKQTDTPNRVAEKKQPTTSSVVPPAARLDVTNPTEADHHSE